MAQLPSLVTGTTIKMSVAPAPKKTHGPGLVAQEEIKPTVPVTHSTGIAVLTPAAGNAVGPAISNAVAAVTIRCPDAPIVGPSKPIAPTVTFFEDGSGNIWQRIPGRMNVKVATINPEGCTRKQLMAMVDGLLSTVEQTEAKN